MKNTLLKYYMIACYLYSTVAMFAQDPGTDDATSTLEETTTDTTPMPIDDYIWVLALVGLFFVYLKFKAIQNKKINN